MHITLSATYTEGPWTGTVQTRYLGAAQLVNGWTSGVQVDNNNVAQVAYLDLRGTYRWNDNIQFYLSVDNVFDTPPPVTVRRQRQQQRPLHHQRVPVRRSGPHVAHRRPLQLLGFFAPGLLTLVSARHVPLPREHPCSRGFFLIRPEPAPPLFH